MAPALLFSVFVVSTCGLVYELISGTLASYLLGDSVTQFSTVIGCYLFAMGVGSYLSRYVTRGHLRLFIQTEVLIALLGGGSAALLFIGFDLVSSFRVLLYLLVFLIGMLVGLEIPLLMEILREEWNFRDLVARVLSFDYVGALVASVLFPLLFIPHFGLVRTSFFFGVLNAAVALWIAILSRKKLNGSGSIIASCSVALVVLSAGFAFSEDIETFAESTYYPDPILYSRSTPYQRIVLTRSNDSLKLYLNSHLQFDSRDEYRYHEALVHVGMAGLHNPKRVLILGGGDGMALREVLKYSSVEKVTLVDLDPTMTKLFTGSDMLGALNNQALLSDKLQVHNVDAFLWLRETAEQFDFVIIDFPDPTSYSLGKLYTTAFFAQLHHVLAPGAAFVVQSTSPILARKSFWCVDRTVREVGFNTLPYHVYVPSFGEWGFILGGEGQIHAGQSFVPGLRFLTPEVVPALLSFPQDMDRVDVETNRLNNQALVRYYESEWSRYSS